MEKIVYVAMSADIIHSGHINVIEEAKKYGKVIVGVLTDEAVSSYKRPPLLSYEIRKNVIENIKGVSEVVKQSTLSYKDNIKKIKPDFVIHGDDWKTGVMTTIRNEVIDLLKEYNGKLIEVPYTKKSETEKIDNDICVLYNTPDIRRAKLKKLLKLKPYLRVIEASNGISGIIVENTKVVDEESMEIKEFDAMWISSLCDSTFKGKPDIELVDLTNRLNTINEIMEVTTKPIILDGDTGGKLEHFVYSVRTFERIGISAVIIEDKIGLKQNSLFEDDSIQTLDDPHNFAKKIKAGKRSQVTRDFMIIARIESLIAGKDVADAINRAKIYIDAGADGIMIHAKDKTGDQIIEFLDEFKKFGKDIPVVLVPTSYNHFTEKELSEKGGNIIIHANHLIRSAYPAMKQTAESILKNGRSLEVDKEIMSIKEIINLIPEVLND